MRCQKVAAACTLYLASAWALAEPSHADAEADETTYMVVNLSAGPDAARFPVRFSATGPDLADDACRTTELWLRRVPAGKFEMGSPATELGRSFNETLHSVTISKPFYMGVFEVTQKQWRLVTGESPAYHEGDARPVESVFYRDIRGAKAGAEWPLNGAADADSFVGRLRAKTALPMDLPTEAQWEYACRAGTTGALNNGSDLKCASIDPSMSGLGRYCNHDQSDRKGGFPSGHTKVGSYRPNAWGLYDMHGNVWEWCLDWYGAYPSEPAKDPAGHASGTYRVMRGGSFRNFAQCCRSAFRNYDYGPADGDNSIGLRLCCPAGR